MSFLVGPCNMVFQLMVHFELYSFNLHLNVVCNFNVYALIAFVWQYATVLQSGTFEDARMPQNLEACDWLASALRSLDAPFLDANYINMRAVSFSNPG